MIVIYWLVISVVSAFVATVLVTSLRRYVGRNTPPGGLGGG